MTMFRFFNGDNLRTYELMLKEVRALTNHELTGVVSERESENGCPARRMTRRRDQDQRQIKRVGDREHDIGTAFRLDVPDAGGRDDARRRQRERGAEKRAGRGHATTEGSGATCQRGVRATLV